MIKTISRKLPYPKNLIYDVIEYAYLYDIPKGLIADAVGSLPEKHQHIILERYKDYISVKEIAKKRLTTTKAIYHTLERDLEKIRKIIKPHITLKPREDRENMVSEENLIDDETFVFGGIEKNFDATAGDFRKYDPVTYENCHHCERHIEDDEQIYAGFFRISPEYSKFHILCRKCAYDMSKQVIEKDGKKHTIMTKGK